MAKDVARRFMLEKTGVRGEWVHLDRTWQEILKRDDYPNEVRAVLGEALAAVVLLSATVKHQGSIILQVRGDGPVHLLVVQATPDGDVRGLARWSQIPEQQDLKSIFGQGQMVITLEAATDNERYQGIIALEGDTLSEALQQYFLQSEQLPTQLWLHSDEHSAAGILIQRLPEQEHTEDDWPRVSMLLDTLTPEELMQSEPELLIYRLFHEETPRLFDERFVHFNCSCSQEKIEQTLLSIGEKETKAILEEQGQIEVQCEFCNSRYVLDQIDVARLFAAGQSGVAASSTVH